MYLDNLVFRDFYLLGIVLPCFYGDGWLLRGGVPDFSQTRFFITRPFIITSTPVLLCVTGETKKGIVRALPKGRNARAVTSPDNLEISALKVERSDFDQLLFVTENHINIYVNR